MRFSSFSVENSKILDYSLRMYVVFNVTKPSLMGEVLILPVAYIEHFIKVTEHKRLDTFLCQDKKERQKEIPST